MNVDAQTYAGWGIDSLKMDGCNAINSHEVMDPAYKYMGKALNTSGRPVMYSCSWPFYVGSLNWSVTAATCNMWRIYADIEDSWRSVQGIIDWMGDYSGNRTHPSPWRAAAGPGSWNDPDALIIGNFALSRTQAETQMAMWSIMAAPLLMGNDLRNLDPEMKAILLADEVIAVDQDPLGKQGCRVFHAPCDPSGSCGCCAGDVWMRELAGGDLAVVLWNRGEDGTHRQVTATWHDLGIEDEMQAFKVRDLFKKKDLGTFYGEFSPFVDIDGVVMVRMTAVGGGDCEVVPPITPTGCPCYWNQSDTGCACCSANKREACCQVGPVNKRACTKCV
jgi:alpha-N-acetylgalactosaminidase